MATGHGTRGLFGRIAVQRGYLTKQQLDAALLAQSQIGPGAPTLGAMLVQRYVLTPAQVNEIIAAQRAIEAEAASKGTEPTLPPPSAGGGPLFATAAAPAEVPVVPVVANAAAAPSRPPPVTGSAVRGARLAQMLEAAERKGSSDMHFHAGSPLALRVEGRLAVLTQSFSVEEQGKILLDGLTTEQRAIFDERGEVDFSFVTPGGLRTRANIYRTHIGVDGTFRLLRRAPQSFDELGLPNTLARLVSYHQGLVLVSGPAGSGKSTTLAALIDLINEERSEHVLLFEEPIEFVHPPKKALVNQRQVGRDTESFARALKGALREDPDIIVIGDLRDRETVSLAITAAETGHLVIGSMQTNSAARTVSRLIDSFPVSQQGTIRAMISESLRGVVAQRLIPGIDGKRVAAVELLLITPAIGNMIRDGKLMQVKTAMTTGKSLGMRSGDDALRELVAAGKITQDMARKYAESPNMFNQQPTPPPPDPPPAPVPPPVAAPPAAAPPRGPLRFPPGKA